MFISKKEREIIQKRIDHCQKKIRILENRAEGQQIEIDRLEKQMKVLSCDHKEVEIGDDEFGFLQKVCKKCGKVFKTYVTHKELLEDMLEFHKEKAAEAEETLKEYENQ